MGWVWFGSIVGGDPQSSRGSRLTLAMLGFWFRQKDTDYTVEGDDLKPRVFGASISSARTHKNLTGEVS